MDVPYVLCTTLYVARHSRYPIYLGGRINRLDSDELKKAATLGFIYAISHGITEIERWESGYLRYLEKHIDILYDQIKDDIDILRFYIKEEFLTKEMTSSLLAIYENTDNVEVKVMLLQYQQDKFGFDTDIDDL
jgi:hypothetical protein